MSSGQPATVTDGLAPSEVQLPPGNWATVFEFLCARFPRVDAAQWHSRFTRGRVLDRDNQPLSPDLPYRVGMTVRYLREVGAEPRIDGDIHLVHRDEHLLVVDKPPFLPVVPAGRFVHETLLARLRSAYRLGDIAPLHRIDRATSGLVMLSLRPDSRARYQNLFAQRAIDKTYEALAPALPPQILPGERRSRLDSGEPFFRMREVAGEANSLTRIECLQRDSRTGLALYRLRPVTGRKHQLRVHMAALGAAILNDPLYPELRSTAAENDDPARPLMLLARTLSFADPCNGQPRHFESRRRLDLASAGFTSFSTHMTSVVPDTDHDAVP